MKRRTKLLIAKTKRPLRVAKKFIVRLLRDMDATNTTVLAAGISYFCALAFFPTFAAALAIASIVITPDQVVAVVENVNIYLPRDIAALITSQLEVQSGRYTGNIIVVAIALGISLFGASAAVQNTVRSLNAIYKVKETRNIIKIRALSVMMLICALLVAGVVLVVLAVDRYMVALGVPSLLVEVVIVGRWPLLVVLMCLAFTALYYFGPNHARRQWRWINWGAIVATVVWLVVTVGLFVYTRIFSTYNESYAFFAGIIVLMVWFNLSAIAVLIGGHIDRRIQPR